MIADWTGGGGGGRRRWWRPAAVAAAAAAAAAASVLSPPLDVHLLGAVHHGRRLTAIDPSRKKLFPTMIAGLADLLF